MNSMHKDQLYRLVAQEVKSDIVQNLNKELEVSKFAKKIIKHLREYLEKYPDLEFSQEDFSITFGLIAVALLTDNLKDLDSGESITFVEILDYVYFFTYDGNAEHN